MANARYGISFLSFLLIFFNAQAYAQVVAEGHYALFHPAWPCNLNVENVSALWNTFGNSFSCAEKLLAKPVKSFELHLLNQTCVRNQRCGSYETLANYTVASLEQALKTQDPKLKRKVEEEAKRASNWLFAHKHDETQCFISPFLEHDLSKDAFLTVVSWISPFFPGCKFVNNPVGNNRNGTEPIKGFIQELHGSHPPLAPPCIANLDGEDIDFPERQSKMSNRISKSDIPQFLSRYKGCETVGLWVLEFNGNCQNQPNFVDPRERTCFPSENLFPFVKGLY